MNGTYPTGTLQADRQAELLGFRDGDEKSCGRRTTLSDSTTTRRSW